MFCERLFRRTQGSVINVFVQDQTAGVVRAADLDPVAPHSVIQRVRRAAQENHIGVLHDICDVVVAQERSQICGAGMIFGQPVDVMGQRV